MLYIHKVSYSWCFVHFVEVLVYMFILMGRGWLGTKSKFGIFHFELEAPCFSKKVVCFCFESQTVTGINGSSTQNHGKSSQLCLTKHSSKTTFHWQTTNIVFSPSCCGWTLFQKWNPFASQMLINFKGFTFINKCMIIFPSPQDYCSACMESIDTNWLQPWGKKEYWNEGKS